MVRPEQTCSECASQEEDTKQRDSSVIEAKDVLDLLNRLLQGQQELLDRVDARQQELLDRVDARQQELLDRVDALGTEIREEDHSRDGQALVLFGGDADREKLPWPEPSRNNSSQDYSKSNPLRRPEVPRSSRSMKTIFWEGLFTADKDADCVTKFALGPWWTILTAVMVILSSVFVGVEIQLEADDVLRNESDANRNLFFLIADSCFLTWLTIEVMVNMYAQKWNFVMDRRYWPWNVLDIAIIMMSVLLEFVKHFYSLSVMRIARIIRLGKILRILRIFKHLHGVRTMIVSMWASSAQFLSACTVMGISMYVTSLVMTQGVMSGVQERRVLVEESHPTKEVYWDGPVEDDETEAIRLYCSISRAMATLFMTISGGMDWFDAARPAAKMGSYLGIVWFVYILFMTFGLLNVLVANFVQSAMQAIQNDKHTSMLVECEHQSWVWERLKEIFVHADTDRDGKLTKDEFRSLLEDEDLKLQLKTLGVESEVSGLFNFLDTDNDKYIMLQEFQEGLWRSRGDATAVDMLMLVHEHRRTTKTINRLHDLIHSKTMSLEGSQSC